MKKLTTEEFIERSNKIHNNIYCYDNSIYKNNSTKIAIYCKIHGYFEQLPAAHMRGQGCSKCKGGIKYGLIEFIEKSNKIHNGRYLYDKSNYIDSSTILDIKCKIHGYFKQLPNNHISGQGCPKCAGKSLTNKEVIEKMNIVHNYKYNYDLSLFDGMLDKIKIECTQHGIFEQKASNHLNLKQGCPKCAGVYLSNKKEFIKKAIKKHGNLYDYNNVIYEGAKINVNIVCKKHGLFTQSPTKHLSGNGCPVCKVSKGEHSILVYLIDKKIKFNSQYKFDNFNLIYDFYLPKYNLCIEYDGVQHFHPVNHFGGKKSFNSQIKRDALKNKYCLEHKINLLRIKYVDYNNINLILDKYFFNS